MTRKRLLLALSILIIVAVPFSVFAATSNTPAAQHIRGFFGIDTSKLTDQQKADVSDYTQKMANLQKDFINKMVANGAITKEQGDSEIKRIDDAIKNGGAIPGFGMGQERFGKSGEGFGINNIDISKLTDQQKADLIAIYQKMADQQKNVINKLVADGLMTTDQGTNAAKNIDNMINNLKTNGLSKGIGKFTEGFGGFEGFRCFGMKGMNTSKLTDQQKADLTDASKGMSDLQKELIDKLVADGVMTKAQGDSAIARIDNMSQKGNGFPNGFGMRGGRFGGHGRQGNPKEASTPTPAN